MAPERRAVRRRRAPQQREKSPARGSRRGRRTDTDQVVIRKKGQKRVPGRRTIGVIRNFGRRRFRLVETHPTKRQAQEYADDLRQKGYTARVVQVAPRTHGVYKGRKLHRKVKVTKQRAGGRRAGRRTTRKEVKHTRGR